MTKFGAEPNFGAPTLNARKMEAYAQGREWDHKNCSSLGKVFENRKITVKKLNQTQF